jgi:hypothetical protein
MPVIICPCGETRTVKPSQLNTARYCSIECRDKYNWLGKHGLSSRKNPHYYLYLAWRSARNRCTRPTDPAYPKYGGRGITMHEQWLTDPRPFVEWVLANLGERPEGHSLDRIDNDGNYEPGNLRWGTRSQQQTNQRKKPSNTGVKGVHRTQYGTYTASRYERALGTYATIEEAQAAWASARP